MKSTTGFALVVALVVCLVSIQNGDACSCMPSHPQTQYCNADFVILAKIKQERIFNETKVYKVRIRKDYKMSEKAAVALKSGRLVTASNGAMCGVQLETGGVYVLTGHIYSLKAHITICNLQLQWKDMSRRQRKGFKSLYKHGCGCKINFCWYRGHCNFAPDTCQWTSPCQTQEGICMRQKNSKCMWNRNKALINCRQKEEKAKELSELTISRWSG